MEISIRIFWNFTKAKIHRNSWISFGNLSAFKSLCFVLSFIVFSNGCFGQSRDKSEASRLQEQRALMIFNLSEQVKWPKIEQLTTFKIGIMGPDTIIEGLKTISKNRRIHDKLIEIKRIDKLEEIHNYNLVYVNHTYEYLIKAIIDSTVGKEVLIITEGYPNKSSMINMVQVGDTYSYDINREYFSNANLRITPILASYAVTSKEIGDKLFKKTEQKLYMATRENEEQKKLIESHFKIIGSQKNDLIKKEQVILEREYSIMNLAFESELKNKKIADNLALEKELEAKLEEQLCQISIQQQNMDSVTNEIKKQQKVLALQNRNIQEKADILEKKDIIINTQRKHNIVLSILSFLLFLACVSLLVAYLYNKKLNKRLKLQHIEIRKKSSLLKSKNNELEQFAYIASHDLQEPLNTISSFIDVIQAEYHNKFDDDGKQILGFIKEGSIRMKRLIDGLLQYSRLGRTKEFQDVNCMPLLEVLIADLQSTIKSTDALINYADLPTIKGNELEIRLLFQNLITNGIKFRDPGIQPKINIECTEVTEMDEAGVEAEKFWKFSITDNGIGIAQEYQERVFSIFQRLHSRLEYEGSGIGLAHCKKIVEAHSGKIWFTPSKDKGTTFCFSIPMKV
ncbi:YfiR/HmsC family protein [Mariniflexile sp.]|uniref:YfiR/HmsC family protein n=1 Tax=Mariniflexile sp. TaxID=1979402 RepID=UPI003568E82F